MTAQISAAPKLRNGAPRLIIEMFLVLGFDDLYGLDLVLVWYGYGLILLRFGFGVGMVLVFVIGIGIDDLYGWVYHCSTDIDGLYG